MALWIFGVFAIGCSGCGEPMPVAAPRHYEQAHGIFGAVAQGDLPLAKELAVEMDSGALSSTPSLPLEFLDSVHGAIGFLIASEDTVEAAEAVAGIGAACGGCHAQVGLLERAPLDVSQLDAAWTSLWRGQRAQAFEQARACAVARGVTLGGERADTAGALDAQAAIAELLALGRGCP